MKTINHFHWGLPGNLRLFLAGFYLAAGAAIGIRAGAGIHALLGDLTSWVF